MTRRPLSRTLRDLALALLNAPLLLVLAIVVAAAVLAAQVRGIADDAGARLERALGGKPEALAARIGAAADRLDEIDLRLQAGPSDAALEALRAELAATRAEVAGLRGDLAALRDAAPEAAAALADRLRRDLAAAIAPAP